MFFEAAVHALFLFHIYELTRYFSNWVHQSNKSFMLNFQKRFYNIPQQCKVIGKRCSSKADCFDSTCDEEFLCFKTGPGKIRTCLHHDTGGASSPSSWQ